MNNEKNIKKFILKDLFTKEKYKLFRIIACSLLIVLILVLSFLVSNTNSNVKETDYNEYMNLYNGSNKSVVVFARVDCSHCKLYLPLVNKISREKKIVINHMDVSLLKDDEYDTVWKSIPNFIRYVDNDHKPVIPTPVTVILQDGKVIDYIEGNIERERLITFFTTNEIIK